MVWGDQNETSTEVVGAWGISNSAVARVLIHSECATLVQLLSLGLLDALIPVMADVTAEGAQCDTIPESLIAPGEGPTFNAQVIGQSGTMYVFQSVTPAASITQGTTDIFVDADGDGENPSSNCEQTTGIRQAWACMHSLNAMCRDLGF